MTSIILSALQLLDCYKMTRVATFPDMHVSVPVAAAVLVTCAGLMKTLAPRISRGFKDHENGSDPFCGLDVGTLSLAARCKATFFLTRELTIRLPLSRLFTERDMVQVTDALRQTRQLRNLDLGDLVADETAIAARVAEMLTTLAGCAAATLEELTLEVELPTFGELFEAAVPRLRNLQKLTLSCSSIDLSTLDAIAAGPGPSLRKLDMRRQALPNDSDKDFLSSGVLDRFVAGCCNLEDLSIDFGSGVSDVALLPVLCQGLPLLRSLDINGSDVDFFSVAKETSAAKANEGQGVEQEERCNAALLSSYLQQLPSLTSITLNDTSATFYSYVGRALADSMPQLESISIRCYPVEPRAIAFVCNSRNLKKLALMSLENQSFGQAEREDYVFEQLPPMLEYLHLENIDDVNIPSLTRALQNLSRQQQEHNIKLKTFSFRHNGRLMSDSDDEPLSSELDDLFAALATFPALEHLVIDKNAFPQTNFAETIPKFAASLRTVRLDNCGTCILDKDLRALCQSCVLLDELIVHDAMRTTDAAYEFLSNLQSLRELHVEGSCEVTSKLLEYIAQCRSLRTVEINSIEVPEEEEDDSGASRTERFTLNPILVENMLRSIPSLATLVLNNQLLDAFLQKEENSMKLFEAIPQLKERSSSVDLVDAWKDYLAHRYPNVKVYVW